MKAKLCGFRTAANIAVAVEHGAWAISFNFYDKSPRFVAKEKVVKLVQKIPNHILKVAILVNSTYEDALEVINSLGFNLVQVHGNFHAPIEFLKHRAILPLNINDINAAPPNLENYAYLLVDKANHSSDQNVILGGTGELANWEVAKILAKQFPVILAGGLNANNVAEAIRYVEPYAVDTASGLETEPGMQCKNKIRDFLRTCHES